MSDNQILLSPQNIQLSNSEIIPSIFNSIFNLNLYSKLKSTARDEPNKSEIHSILSFLSKEKLGWDHLYIPKIYKANNLSACALCGYELEAHLNKQLITQKTEAIINRYVRNMEERLWQRFWSISEDIFNVCEICYQKSDKIWSLPTCPDHFFCHPCIISYIDYSITNNNLKIPCPCSSCNEILSELDILLFIPKETLMKHKKIIEYQLLAQDPTVKFCITPNCEGIIKGSLSEDPHKFCSVCNLEMCFNCGKIWHISKTCEEIENEEYNNWELGKNVKRCPNCRYKIEKSEGCDHMTCVMCKSEFCWKCGIKWFAGHNQANCLDIRVLPDYNNQEIHMDNPNGQNNENNNAQEAMPADNGNICFMCLLFLLSPLVIALFVLFFPAYLVTKVVYKKSRHRSQICKGFLLCSTFLLAFILTPVLCILSILIVPCWLFIRRFSKV